MRLCSWLRSGAQALLLGLLGSGTAGACEGFSKLDAATARKMMGVLRQANADVLDQMEAFKILSCAEEPTLRSYAITEGIRSQGAMIRSMALAEQLFQRDQIRIDLLPDTAATDQVKRWVTERGGAIVYKIGAVNRPYNCLSFHSGLKCNQQENEHRLTIDRENIRVIYQELSANLSLQADGSLRGFVKPAGSLPDIPARILLQ